MTGHEAFQIVQETGRSQAEIARLIGVSAMAVQKWRNGHPPSEPVALLLSLFRERPEVMDVVARMRGLT